MYIYIYTYIYVYICIYIYIYHGQKCTWLSARCTELILNFTGKLRSWQRRNTLQHTATHCDKRLEFHRRVQVLTTPVLPPCSFIFTTWNLFTLPASSDNSLEWYDVVRGGTRVLHCTLRVFVSSDSVDFCCTCTVCAHMDVHVSFSLLLQHLRHRYTAQWQCGKSRGAIRWIYRYSAANDLPR